jgi:hypothetical protein
VQTIATPSARTAQSQLPAELLTLAKPPLRVSHTGESVSLALPPFFATAIAFEVPSDDASQTAVSPVLAMSPDLETHRTPSAASAKTIAAHASILEITLSAPGVTIDAARPDAAALRLNCQPVSIKTTIAETLIAAVLHRWMSTFPQPASSRPYHAPTEIAVRQELGSQVGVRKIYQHYLESRFPSLFHRGNAVGVLRDEDQPFDDSIIRIGRDIQAYPHVNALLFENRLEVLVGNRAGDDGRLSWLVSPKLEHTSADREKVLLSQVAQPLVGTVKLMPLS